MQDNWILILESPTAHQQHHRHRGSVSAPWRHTAPHGPPGPVRGRGGPEGLLAGETSQNRDLCRPRSRRKLAGRSSKFLKTRNNATIVPRIVIDRSWQCRLRPSWPTPQNDAFCASRLYCLEMCEAFRDAKRQLQWKPSLPRDASSMAHSRLSLSTPAGGISAAYSFPRRQERGRQTQRSGAKHLSVYLRASEAF